MSPGNLIVLAAISMGYWPSNPASHQSIIDDKLNGVRKDKLAELPHRNGTPAVGKPSIMPDCLNLQRQTHHCK